MSSLSITSLVHHNYLSIVLLFLSLIFINETLSYKTFKRDSWKSSLPVSLPEPGDVGIPITNINHYEDDDNEDDVHDLQVISKYNIGAEFVNLSAGHRCYLNEHCQEHLQCRTFPQHSKHFPHDPDIDYGICTQVDCNPDCHQKNTTMQCPSDSIMKAPLIENNGQRCCFRFCVCNKSKCIENKDKCPRGYHKLEEAKGMPGKCCDLIECDQFIHKNCTDTYHRTYDSGQLWQRLEDCHLCKCIDGVWKCEAIDNCPTECLPANSNVKLKPDQCCLPCKSCIHEGLKYEHLQTWLDNDCRRCECKNEKYVCNYEFGGTKFCDRPCTIFERREWQKDKCCDKCECTLNCPYGFKTNTTNGNNLCQCQDDNLELHKQTLINNIDSTTKPAQVMSAKKQETIGETFFYVIAFIMIFLLLFMIYFCIRLKKRKSSNNTNHEYQSIKYNEDKLITKHDEKDKEMTEDNNDMNGTGISNV